MHVSVPMHLQVSHAPISHLTGLPACKWGNQDGRQYFITMIITITTHVVICICNTTHSATHMLTRREVTLHLHGAGWRCAWPTACGATSRCSTT